MKKLEVGMIFKNYKHLCEFMGWKVATGNTRVAQLKKMDSILKYHKEGNKIIIDEVYENIGFEADTNIRKGKYNVEVGSSILAVVTSREKNDKGVVYITQKELILNTELANKKLFNNYMAKGFTKLEVKSYKEVAKKMTYKAIEGGLSWLNSSRVLKNEKVKFAKIFNYETENYELREVDEVEERLIFEGEQAILSELGYDSMFKIIANNEFESFGKKVTNYIYDNYGIKIEFYYSTIKFTITKFSEERSVQLAIKKVALKRDIWEKTHKALTESATRRKKANYEFSKKAMEYYKYGMEENFSDKDFINIVYAYPDYEINFEALDIIYRKCY